MRGPKPTLLFPVDTWRREKEGTQTVGNAASPLIVISTRVLRNVEGLRGVLRHRGEDVDTLAVLLFSGTDLGERAAASKPT